MRTHHLVSIGFVLGLVACSSAERGPVEPPVEPTPPIVAKTGPAGCSPGIPGTDPGKLPACKGTKGVSGRCVGRASLGEFKDTFEQASCAADAACVPEDVVSKGSALELKTCKAVLDSDGRCFWALAKDIIDNYDVLKSATADQCGPDQVCAPCINPLDKTSTHVCELGGGPATTCAPTPPPGTAAIPPSPAPTSCPFTGTPLDTSAFPQEDCGSNMLCIAPALVGSADLAALLKPCASGVCAPRKAIAAFGNYLPKTCVSIAGAEGRCSNIGIPDVGAQASVLPVADCDPDERCAPCFDPTSGKETGACSTVSCDKPQKPATTLTACCGGKASCVPKASVPSSLQSKLGKDSCKTATDLCVPNDYVKDPSFQPKACKSTLLLIGGKGACVSTCLPSAKLLPRDGCAADEACAPCSQMPAGTTVCGK